jgi:hypothetical protein
MRDTQEWKRDPVLGRLKYCWCSDCLCNLPLNPRRGYCDYCIKNECWSLKKQPHFSGHKQCQEYFESIVNEMGT